MATQNTTTYNVEVTDGGSTKRLISNIETLISKLKNAQNEAKQGINTGGTTGSRSLSESAMSGSSYGKLRATGTGTGAAARDFAKESQGLGGLVRLYATYAANVFALSAAFGALSRAMDTTNMIRSTDQLGASVGKSLGSVSKNIVQLTDGAISLQESLQAVAKTSTAGIANKDIERLAVVAKNASLSLGISLPDALSRLSRGVVKLEPELLDELGLFTKIGPATEAYARSVGKTVGSLTDFEKRQAFTNAVIKEGEDKFSALGAAVNANPYDKLLASLQNLAQTGLELVNKVLGPIINLLSENPAALTAAIAAIGIALIKQALPAFGQFKEGLRSAADDAKDLAIQKADEARQARKKIERLATKDFEQEADNALKAVVAQEKKIEQLRKKGQFDPAGATAQALAKDTADVNGRDFKKMEEERRKYLKEGNAQAAQAVKGTMESFKAYQTLEDQVTKVRMAEEARTKELEKGNTRLASNIEAARKAQDNYTKETIVSAAATNQGLIGASGAWQLLKQDIDSSGLELSKFEKASLKARGGVAILTSAIVDLGAAVGNFVNRILMVIAVYEILDSFLSSNSKELQKFSSALDTANESVDNTNRTLKLMFGTMNGNVNSIEGINALANAFREVSRSADEAAIAAAEAKRSIQTGNLFDKFKDFASSAWGGDVDSKLADTLSKQILSSIDLARASGVGDKFEAEIKDLLKINNFNTSEVTDALVKLGNEGAKPVREKIKQFGIDISNADSKLQKFKSSVETTTKSYQDYLLSVSSQDPLFKLGQNINNLGVEMETLTQGSFKEFNAALLKLGESPEKIAFFGDAFTTQFIKIRSELQQDSKLLSQFRGQLVEAQKAQREFEDANTSLVFGSPSKMTEQEQLQNLGTKGYSQYVGLKANAQIAAENVQIVADKDSFEKAKTLFVTGMNSAFDKGAELIQTALKNGAELNAVKIARASAQFLTGAEKAREEGKLNQQEFAIRLKTIKSNVDLMLNQDRLIAVIAENTAAVTVANLKDSDNQALKEQAQAQLDATKAFRVIIDKQLKAGQIPNFKAELNAELDWGRPLSELGQAMLKQMVGNATPRYAALAQGMQDVKAAAKVDEKTTEGKVIQGKAEDQKRRLTAEASVTQAMKDQLALKESILGVADETLITTENQKAQEILLKNQAKELADATAAVATAKLATGVINKESVGNAEAILKATQERHIIELDTKAIQDRQKLLQFELQAINRAYEINKANLDVDIARSQVSYNMTMARLGVYAKLSSTSEQFLANETARIELARADEDSAEKLRAIEIDRAKKIDEINKKIDVVGSDSGELTKEMNQVTELAEIAKQKVKIETDGKKDILNLNKQIALVEAKIAERARQYELEQSKAQTNYIEKNAALEKSRMTVSALGDIGGAGSTFATGMTNKALENQQRIAEFQESNRKLNAEENRNNQDAGDKIFALKEAEFKITERLAQTKSLMVQQTEAEKTETRKLQDDLIANKNLQKEIGKEAVRRTELTEEERKKLAAQNEIREHQIKLDTIRLKLAEDIRQVNLNAALETSKREIKNSERLGELELKRSKLDVYAQNNSSAEVYLAKIKSINEEETARLQTQIQISNLQAQTKTATAIAGAQKVANQALTAAGKQTPDQQAAADALITLELSKQTELNNNAILNAQVQLDYKLKSLAVTTEQNIQQAKYNELLRASNDLSTSLKDTFGLFGDKVKAVGEALGETVTRLTESNIRQEKSAKQQLEDEKKLNDLKSNSGADEQSIIDLQNKMADDKKKNNKEELKGDLAAISSTKKMFKEKTAAYKIFAAIEKALAIAQVASNAMVLASKLTTEAGTTAATTAGTAARMPAYITDIWGQTLGKLPFPMGGIVGAGLVALLLAAFGKGGSSKAPPMVTAAQRQETQGTAMGYNAVSEKIQVRRGVFGDENAKSESIDNSLKLIAENSVDGLDYDNKMLNALKGLRDALTESAQALFGVKGLRSGTAFGTVEGANSSGGWFGVSGLFGKTTTRNIIDSGIKIAGTFLDLAKAGSGVIQTFETVSTTTKSSGFFGIGSSSKTSVGTNFGMLDPKAEAALRNAFSYAGDLLYSIGEKAGKLPDEIAKGMAGVSVDELVSLRGLTGEDFSKELSNVVGAILDDATFAIFSEFEKFAKFGEGMLETVVRVIDTNTKVNQAIKNIGTSISGQLTQSLNFSIFGIKTSINLLSTTYDKLTNDISEALVKAADGLDNFLDKVENFRSNFLTEAEQLAPINAAYRKGLIDLGYSADISREELKSLIQNFDLFNPAAGRAGKTTAETYIALLDIANGFDKVADAAESAAKKISDERDGLKRKLDELTLTTEQLRDIDVSKLDASNQALQRQVFAMQDMQTAAKTLQTRLNDVTKTMKSQITSLTDYRQSLMIGDKSTLTAVDQYQLAKKNLTDLYQTATSTTATEEQRNTALGKLQGASDQVLTLSRQLFASGEQYSVDQATVIGIIDATKADLEARKTDAELQLETLKTSNSYLQSIDTASQTTAQLIETYLASVSTYNTAATAAGGNIVGIPKLASGTNYVPYDMLAQIHQGERIIPAADNQQLMNTNMEMVQEIRLLNQRIGDLEQAIVEGAVINAQATDRNTETLSTAIGANADKAIQSARIQTRATIK